jgi:hypothetical protein
VFVNNSVKVVSNAFDSGKDEREDERTVSRSQNIYKNERCFGA